MRYLSVALSSLMLLSGCAGDDLDRDAAPEPDRGADARPPDAAPLKDAATPDSPLPVHTTIGPSGGTVVSADGKLALEVPPGAIDQATEFTVVIVRDVPRNSASVGYDIGPTGMPFAKPATLRIGFDESALEGVDAARLRLGMLVGSSWQEVPRSDVDTVALEARGMLEHLSVYGVFVGKPPGCGDGKIDGSEQCDRNDLADASCSSQGFDGGTLACNPDCTFDTSDCHRCGDGKANGDEQCDGSDLDGKWCGSLGFNNGALGCAADCTFDTSACNKCGDGAITGNEQCEGNDLGGATCADVGFDGGTLACRPTCTFDTASCYKCHDGVINGSEQCEGNDLGGATCAMLGFDAGTLLCAADCTFDTSKCSTCGDGVASGDEECDGSDHRGATCVTRGFDGGSLSCAADCTFDPSKCYVAPWCGDGARNGAEQCEGADLGGESCVSLDLGYTGGVLGCKADCTFDTSSCATCGNDIIETGEDCEPNLPITIDCVALGFDGGELSCDDYMFCKWNTYACYPPACEVAGGICAPLTAEGVQCPQDYEPNAAAGWCQPGGECCTPISQPQ